MLKIGEFSRLSQVTVKTLHHYDDIGLLKPSQIDSFTNYRYYTVDLLPRIHQIMALKELGLSLEQICLTLNDDLTPEQIRGMLSLKHAEIKQVVQQEQARLARVEFRLRMLEMEQKMTTLDVIVKKIPPQYALTIRRAMKREDMVPFGIEIEQAFAQHGVEVVGPFSEIRFEQAFHEDHDHDVEFVMPVSTEQKDAVPLKTFGVLEPKTIVGLNMAATHIIKGVNPTEFQEKLALLQRWIVENEYQLCDANRVVFHRGPAEHAEYEDWIIEFQQEIEPA